MKDPPFRQIGSDEPRPTRSPSLYRAFRITARSAVSAARCSSLFLIRPELELFGDMML